MNRSQRRSTNRSLRPNMNQSLLRSSTNRDRNQHHMPLRRNMLALRGKRSLRNFEADVEEVDVKGGRFLWMKPKGPPFLVFSALRESVASPVMTMTEWVICDSDPADRPSSRSLLRFPSDWDSD